MTAWCCRYNDWALPAGVVRGLSQASAALALGSAFYHGSHTRLGSLADNKLIGVRSRVNISLQPA